MSEFVFMGNKRCIFLPKCDFALMSDMDLTDKSSSSSKGSDESLVDGKTHSRRCKSKNEGIYSPGCEAEEDEDYDDLYSSSKGMNAYKKAKYQHVDQESLKKKILKSEMKNKICICLSSSRYDVFRRVSRELGYKIVRESELWNICWTDSTLGVEFCKDMRRFQMINHFPGMLEICRKDLLARNLSRMLRAFPLDYQIFPKTWCFPADLGDAMAYSKTHRNRTYIIKPDQGAQGKGIWLTKNLRDIKPNERMICQLYIPKPLLIDNFKFDLRVYALITSTDPLRIFVYNEGLARFATSKYREPSGHNTANIFMHLTNYSVNKHSRTYSVDDEEGSKRKFSAINKILAEEGHNVKELWANIDDIIVKTFLSAYPMLKHNYTACFPSHDIIQACFEILGIDILIDSKLKPYILEVNHSPSFHTSEPIDMEVKDALIKDAFNILHISPNDKKRVLEEDKKRVKSRLLQKIKFVGKDKQSNEDLIGQQKSPEEIWAAQIEWEENNMGGYRRIMPPSSGDPHRYDQFFVMQNHGSVYSETAASKRREECAKQQRKDIAERFTQRIPPGVNKMSKLKPITEEGDEKLKLIKKKRKCTSLNLFDSSTPDINDGEERQRINFMAQRDFLVKSCGLLHNIILSFHQNKILTTSDKRKYKEVCNKLLGEEKLKNPGYFSNVLEEQREKQHMPKLKGIMNTISLGLNCAEAPINILPPIPTTFNYRSNKATCARQMTNSVKMQNIETRENWPKETNS